MINNDIESILVSQEELDKITQDIADRISADYRGKRLLLLCILKGSVVFMGDLMKKISIPVEIDFMKVSSYGRSTASSGTPTILLDLHRSDISDIDILIVRVQLDTAYSCFLQPVKLVFTIVVVYMDRAEGEDPLAVVDRDCKFVDVELLPGGGGDIQADRRVDSPVIHFPEQIPAGAVGIGVRMAGFHEFGQSLIRQLIREAVGVEINQHSFKNLV